MVVHFVTHIYFRQPYSPGCLILTVFCQPSVFESGIGRAAHYINQPYESVFEGDQKGKLPVKGTVHAGARFQKLHYGLLSREFTLSPNIIYQQQASFKQLNFDIYTIENYSFWEAGSRTILI